AGVVDLQVLRLLGDHEEALPGDAEVGALGGALQLTRLAGVVAGVGQNAAGRIARALHLTVDHGRELGGRALVAHRVHVRDVLGDGRQGGGVGGQAGHAGQKGAVDAHGAGSLRMRFQEVRLGDGLSLSPPEPPRASSSAITLASGRTEAPTLRKISPSYISTPVMRPRVRTWASTAPP